MIAVRSSPEVRTKASCCIAACSGANWPSSAMEKIRLTSFRGPSPNDRIELPRKPDGISSLYPRAAGRPSGNVQLWSPFLSQIERLGIDLNEVLFGAGSSPP
jgi:hypothetical protein